MRITVLLLILAATVRVFAADAAPTYKDIRPILAKHCLSCHDPKEAEGKLLLDTHANLIKGGESGPAIIPGKSSDSPLIKQVEHKEKPFMPPPKKGDRLTGDEIALLRKYIDAGAKPPAPGEDTPIAAAPTLPKIDSKAPPRRAVHAMAYDPKAKLLALAVLNEVELRSAENQATVATLKPHKGQ